MATNSGWSKSVPSSTSKVSDGDDAIRSFKSYMQAWWEADHYGTDGSAASAGIGKVGTGRAFQGAASALSNPTGDNSGKGFLNDTTGQFMVANASTSSWSATAPAYASIALVSTSTQTISAGADGATVISSTQNLFTIGDYLVMSYDTTQNAGAHLMPTPLLGSDRSVLRVYWYNPTASDIGLPVGTTLRVLGFKH